jgi:DnaK suppressor protein
VTVDLESRRIELLDLRQRLTSAAEGILADDEENGELTSGTGDQHLADHASDTLDHEMDWTLEENAEHILTEIDRALAQLEQGTYGTCMACGRPIPEERLEALPYATLCVEDRRRQERG